MGTLLIVRHAKSDWNAGQPDHERPLNVRGRREAPLLGAELRHRGFTPDLAICSDASRAQQTWQLASRAFRGAIPTVIEPRLYDATRGEVLDLIRETADEVGTLAVIGHEPTSSAVATMLAGRSEPLAAKTLALGLKTACAAVLTFAGPWSDLDPGQARLEQIVVQPADRSS